MPRALESICLKALAAQPEDRYAIAHTTWEGTSKNGLNISEFPVAVSRPDGISPRRAWAFPEAAGSSSGVESALY